MTYQDHDHPLLVFYRLLSVLPEQVYPIIWHFALVYHLNKENQSSLLVFIEQATYTFHLIASTFHFDVLCPTTSFQIALIQVNLLLEDVQQSC